MPFRRRVPATLSERLRAALWPRMGLRRSLRYVKLKLVRLSASPYSVAAGVAIGVAVAWTPFLGVHIIIAMVIGFILRANLVAAALGTTFANPLTFPLIWASTWELGHLILGRGKAELSSHIDFVSIFSHMNFLQLWKPVLEPMAIGSLIPAAISAVVTYAGVYAVIRGFRHRKHQQIAERAANRNSAMGIIE
ncbi:DUF2062 domain-containing protein [Agrobacterium larrymoorei]|uniref:DUF2062 domain-containing protein n=1 Tax=Agrobacterium larrymoorei TaxID=160699 RepID=A0AAF0H7L4_9HYPH|nr:DUF2062 domain-containing protein [Agrobacterium larrymoorei]WHA40327.1 DUF2062 domain-containing protein [Agrobacterium larrymoorei]